MSDQHSTSLTPSNTSINTIPSLTWSGKKTNSRAPEFYKVKHNQPNKVRIVMVHLDNHSFTEQILTESLPWCQGLLMHWESFSEQDRQVKPDLTALKSKQAQDITSGTGKCCEDN